MRFCSSAAVKRDSECFLWSESPTKTKVPRAWDEGHTAGRARGPQNWVVTTEVLGRSCSHATPPDCPGSPGL